MATFNYKDKTLLWDPEHGYRDIATGEWVPSPLDAVIGYVSQAPEEREEWLDLASRVQSFWAANVTQSQDLRGFEEVTFDA